MSELQSTKFIRRQEIKTAELPQNLKDKYDQLVVLSNMDSDELEESAINELEIEITAKDNALLRELRRFARDSKASKDNAKKEQDEKPKPTKSSWTKWI